MRRSGRSLIVIFTVATMLITGCSRFEGTTNALEIKASGTNMTEELPLTGFDRVDAANAFDVTLTQGDTFSVTLRVDENVHEYLDVHVDSDTLLLKLKDRNGGYSLQGSVTLEATIVMPHLRAVTLSGASKGTVSGFEAESLLNVQLSGASSLTGEFASTTTDIQLSGASRMAGELGAESVTIGASGDSHIEVHGSAQTLTLDLSGASEALLYTFTISGDGDVNVSGASRVEVTVNGVLNVTASGASRVRYQGDATMGKQDISGGSSVEAAN